MSGMLGGVRINDQEALDGMIMSSIRGKNPRPVVMDTSEELLLAILNKLDSLETIGMIGLQ